jgi:hypothetical protein
MSCPLLAKYLKNPSAVAEKQGLVRKRTIDSVIAAAESIQNKDECRHKIGRQLYFMAGSELASRRDFNSMTFLQLEQEARVQGLLSPSEPNYFGAWRLRLKLEIKTRQKRVAAGLPAEANSDASSTSDEDEAEYEGEEEEEEKTVLTCSNGTTMRF